MIDGPGFNPDAGIPAESILEKRVENKVESKEGLPDKKGIVLYNSDRFNVFVPKNPNIPLNEGLHVQVSDGHDLADSPKEVLARYLMAEGAAKEMAESGLTPNAWSNTRLEQGQVVSAYGIDPVSKETWRKPLVTLNRNVPEINSLESNYNTQKLQELSGRYLKEWEELAENMNLFKDGVGGQDMNEASREGFILWQNNKIKLEIIMNPHLKGLHLMVSPKESFQRQWQTVRGQNSDQTYLQQTIEITAVAMGVQKLLADGRGELHNSGNWNGGLKTTEEGGKLNLEKLAKNPNIEKRSHRPDRLNTNSNNGTIEYTYPSDPFGTNMHTHVYLPFDGPVILPEMSKDEATQRGRTDVVKQWEEIPPTSLAQLEGINAKLGEGKLTKWLEENCQGQLIIKTV